MRRNTALAARIAKLEAARRPIRTPRLCFTLFDQNEAVTGICGPNGAAAINRMPGELLPALVTRAWTMFGGSSLWATYPQSVWNEPEQMPPEIADLGWSEPEQIQPDQADPFALAGIGRKATDEELAKMGIAPRYR